VDDSQQQITEEIVAEVVHGGRAKTAWEMIDQAAAGNAAAALAQLDLLLAAGENPIGLLAQVSWKLRPFAAATRLIMEGEQGGRRMTLKGALEDAGVKFKVSEAETQLKQIGRARGAKILPWLMEADLGMKGESALPPRVLLEQLLLRLSRASARPAS
jgi:DNA polymerase-3 subunit delta